MTLDEIGRKRAALIIGHPGHELRVHRWLELARPSVHVLTDGSGRTGRSRLDSTRAVLARAGATQGLAFGCCSDGELYDALLSADATILRQIMVTLADALSTVDYVIADALEGFNPAHDVCRLLVNAAVALVAQRSGREILNYDFLLDGSPRQCPDHLRAAALCITLDDDDLSRKVDAALGYPELRSETEHALERFGKEAFRVEMLRPVVDRHQGLDHMDQEPPYYERYGERQVAAGHYRDVIRYRANVRPVARALWQAVEVESQ